MSIAIGGILALVAIYTLVFWVGRLDLQPRWLVYIESLYRLGVIVAIAGFVLNQLLSERRRKDQQITALIRQQEQGFIRIEDMFMQYYPDLFRLYKEMNLHNSRLRNVPDPPQVDPIRRTQLEVCMANHIFQSIENMVLMSTSTSLVPSQGPSEGALAAGPFAEWVTTWRQWLQSPTLRRYWLQNRKIFFSAQTRALIDPLIAHKIDPLPK